jgi:aspartyl/asparaginyl beta-hydroxylase (cupin superfamily)
MEEHKVILNSLNELGSLVERLKEKNNFEDMGEDLENLQEEWEEVKREADKVGYCCFTPGDQKKEEEKQSMSRKMNRGLIFE